MYICKYIVCEPMYDSHVVYYVLRLVVFYVGNGTRVISRSCGTLAQPKPINDYVGDATRRGNTDTAIALV